MDKISSKRKSGSPVKRTTARVTTRPRAISPYMLGRLRQAFREIDSALRHLTLKIESTAIWACLAGR